MVATPVPTTLSLIDPPEISNSTLAIPFWLDAVGVKPQWCPAAVAPAAGRMTAVAGPMFSVRVLVADCAGVEESVTRTVKLNVPATVGSPWRIPAELSVIPEGNAPPLTAQVYGAAPPFSPNT